MRHGESLSNAGHKTSNNTIVPLSSLGVEQSKNYANNQEEPSLILYSPFTRAIQTAIPLLQKFPEVPH